MSKPMRRMIAILLAAALMLTGCGGAGDSWDTEEVVAASQRIMAEHVTAQWTLLDGQGGASGAADRIRIELRKTGGEPVRDFDINHEKLLHLIIVSKDLSYFNHVHPEYKGEGVFEIENEFPSGGDYRVIADFKPTGGDSMTKLTWMKVEGKPVEPVPVTPAAPGMELIQPAGGNKVALTIDQLTAGQESRLTFTLSDERTNEPVTDLEPYLGAIGHVVILSEDGERYVHVHAEEGQTTGPDAVFETSFPRSGVYKIWGQFQRAGVVFTAAYVVQAAEAAKP
jgi:hypothetical protein